MFFTVKSTHVSTVLNTISTQQGLASVLPILSLAGGDIVHAALSVAAGTRGALLPAPVTYSSGWTAYIASAVLAACKGRSLLPTPDCQCTLVNALSGQYRENRSWVLARLLKDYTHRKQNNTGLSVVFLHASHTRQTGVRTFDGVYIMGIATIVVQLAIAYAPVFLYRNYSIFWSTLSGTILALLIGCLPQWSMEKWAAREVKNKREVMCLTEGNGSNTVLVIVNDGTGLRLEDLASGRVVQSRSTVPAVCLLAALFVVHLLAVANLSSDAWYLFAVAALGTVQNLITASSKLTPSALGLDLVEDKVIQDTKVFAALQAAEAMEPHVGLALLPTFFPGGLRESERQWRDVRQMALSEEEASDKRKGAEKKESV